MLRVSSIWLRTHEWGFGVRRPRCLCDAAPVPVAPFPLPSCAQLGFDAVVLCSTFTLHFGLLDTARRLTLALPCNRAGHHYRRLRYLVGRTLDVFTVSSFLARRRRSSNPRCRCLFVVLTVPGQFHSLSSLLCFLLFCLNVAKPCRTSRRANVRFLCHR